MWYVFEGALEPWNRKTIPKLWDLGQTKAPVGKYTMQGSYGGGLWWKDEPLLVRFDKKSSMFIKHLGKRSDLMQRPTLNFLVIAYPCWEIIMLYISIYIYIIVENLFSLSGNPPTWKIQTPSFLVTWVSNSQGMKKPAAKVAKLSSLTSASWTVPKRWVFLPTIIFQGANSLSVRGGMTTWTCRLRNTFFFAENFVSTKTHQNFAPATWRFAGFLPEKVFTPPFLLSMQMRPNLETVKKKQRPKSLVICPNCLDPKWPGLGPRYRASCQLRSSFLASVSLPGDLILLGDEIPCSFMNGQVLIF